MRYGSVCSGMEAATCAWHPLGWEPVFFSEIDNTASRFLAARYPEIPNYGDMTNYKEWPHHDIDLLVGGTPCQSFSVAGLRRGLEDPRGNLMLTYLGVADKYRPRVLVWENVPGVLSSNGGRDFGSFLGALGKLGYGFAYRVLDAQYVRVESHGRAVPQRRRRVFVVGCLGDWQRAAAVLFERESMSGNPPSRRQAGQGAPADAAEGAGIRSHWDGGQHPHPTLNQSHNTGGVGASNQELFSQRGAYLVGEAVPPVANPLTARMHKGVNTTMDEGQTMVVQSWRVRRLTPLECLRLQGFPDDYFDKARLNKPLADGPKYKLLGNSMAVNVMRWIGERIQMEDMLS